MEGRSVKEAYDLDLQVGFRVWGHRFWGGGAWVTNLFNNVKIVADVTHSEFVCLHLQGYVELGKKRSFFLVCKKLNVC